MKQKKYTQKERITYLEIALGRMFKQVAELSTSVIRLDETVKKFNKLKTENNEQE